MKNFYCKPFTEDGMMTDQEKCVKQCDTCAKLDEVHKASKLLAGLVDTATAYNDGVEAGLPEDELNKLFHAYNDVLDEAREYLADLKD